MLDLKNKSGPFSSLYAISILSSLYNLMLLLL